MSEDLGDRESHYDPITEWGAFGTFHEPYHFSLKVIAALADFADKYSELLGQPSLWKLKEGEDGDQFAQTLVSSEKYQLGF